MVLIPKDPVEWLNLFRQQMTTIFRHLSLIEARDHGGMPEFSPALDVSETADRFVVEVDLPGGYLEDLTVTICCSVLVIEGKKRQDLLAKEINLLCLERRYGHFCRTVEIPPGFSLEQVQASFHRGVLTVDFPRFPATQSVVREVVIEQGEF